MLKITTFHSRIKKQQVYIHILHAHNSASFPVFVNAPAVCVHMIQPLWTLSCSFEVQMLTDIQHNLSHLCRSQNYVPNFKVFFNKLLFCLHFFSYNRPNANPILGQRCNPSLSSWQDTCLPDLIADVQRWFPQTSKHNQGVLHQTRPFPHIYYAKWWQYSITDTEHFFCTNQTQVHLLRQ